MCRGADLDVFPIIPQFADDGSGKFDSIATLAIVSSTRYGPPTSARNRERQTMAKLALVYGMRLFPAEELDAVQEAPIKLKGGRNASITMHLIEGSKKEDIERVLRQSIDAFFEMYPEI
jgi:hypothetical protein